MFPFGGQRFEGVVTGGLGPSPEHSVARREAVEEAEVLLVGDEQVHALPPDDLTDLRSGEVGVEHDDAAAELARGVHGVLQAAMVARQDRHAVAGTEPHPVPAVSDGVGTPVLLAVGSLCRARR